MGFIYMQKSYHLPTMLVYIYDDLVRKVLSLTAPGLLAQRCSGRTSEYLPSSNNRHSICYIANLFFLLQNIILFSTI